MRIEFAQAAAAAAERMGWDVELRPEYSGRGMYGQTTAALVGDRDDIVRAAMLAAHAAGAAGRDAFESLPDHWLWDNLGRSAVAY